MFNFYFISVLCRLFNTVATKVRLLNAYVLPVLLYGAETWSLTAALEKKLDAFHQWCLKRLFRLSYLRHVTNVEVLRLTRKTGRLKMREWKMRYGQKCKGGKCRSGKCGSIGSRGGKCRSRLAVWKAESILYSDTA